jgi:hypothetical protein
MRDTIKLLLNPGYSIQTRHDLLVGDTQQVRPWLLISSTVEHSVHGMDGRLANIHGSPFQHQRNLLTRKPTYKI